MSVDKKDQRVDFVTLVAVAIVAYAITNVVHEAGGHGGTCLLVGGKAIELNAVYFQCGEASLSPAAERWVSAGGTLANLALAAGIQLATSKSKTTPLAYFAWLLQTLCLLQATGYLLFSGVMGIGDWTNVTEGLEPQLFYRALLSVGGAVGYYLSIRHALRGLVLFLGPSNGRIARALKLTLVPYLTGGALYLAAGVLNPVSPMLVLISAAAASLGGTSALAWMNNLLRDERRYPPDDASELALPRSLPTIGVAAMVALVFVVVLGRSVRF